MPDYLGAILLGLIEGVAEFLPISSTGHLLIAEQWLGARSDTFTIVIQSGSILAVALIYRQRIWQLLSDWRDADNRDYLFKLMAAFGVTGVLGVMVDIAGFQLPETVLPVALALVLGGIAMLVIERLVSKKPRSSEITWKVALLVGLAQILAGIFPGLSRSCSTIFVALLAGANDRARATEFSFLLGIPTMFAASGYKLIDQAQSGIQEDWLSLGLGFLAAMLTGFVAVKWLLSYINTHQFTVFAIYRIIFGGGLLLYFGWII